MAGERTLPGQGLTAFYTLGDSTWKTGIDADFLKISSLLQGAVISQVTTLPGSPTNGDMYIVPSGAGSHPNEIAVRDNGAWTYYTPTEGTLMYVKDTDKFMVFNASAWAEYTPSASNTYYDIRAGFVTTPTATATIDTIMVGRTVTFPANFSGSLGHINTNPTSSFVMTVYDDGVSIGTITVSTGGAFTFATGSGTSKVVAIGSVLTIVAPGTPDATAAGLTVTLLGSAA